MSEPDASASPFHRDLARDILLRLRARGARPGDRLSRLGLAREFGVSRTPVLASLALLERLGVVVTEGRSVRLLDPGYDPARLDVADETALLVLRIARERRDGNLPEEVSERMLRQRTGASRTALHEALHHLESVGIATRNRGHGWRLGMGFASEEERVASYRFRLMLEPAALLEPGFTLPRDRMAALRESQEAALRRPWREGDVPRFYESAAGFHLALAQGCGNRFVIQAVEMQNRLRHLHGLHLLDRARVHDAAREHLGILDALEMGDRALAAERMRAHLQGSLAPR
ncbi:GntR family transcriptional regulator [Roseomonas gilardii subsp. gilardii]|uniref:GntR family transcriptional regulator n=1 Tax=Roseomonas gilardii TaxID=257708 RepID=UPI001FF848AF|nr:GntR family transcriptional regulator [Roseomonas gilardii]UPG74149.1 GntR family transcriptional regulator [Roseomonas gilardii subsp. gilardii]